MKALRIVLICLAVYVGIVVVFESLLGVVQPQSGEVLVITTYDDGGAHDRVVSRLEVEGQLYVAANHWPRAWYHRALEHPDVEVTIEGEQSQRRVVGVTGAEHDRVAEARPLPLAFRVLTGFPMRRFVRLDARES